MKSDNDHYSHSIRFGFITFSLFLSFSLLHVLSLLIQMLFVLFSQSIERHAMIIYPNIDISTARERARKFILIPTVSLIKSMLSSKKH